ncbi:MAG TPA: hypothetical protein VFU35_09155 [Jatrophihabitans sp.]|nr:hypothetical protein [Jatrophihabitans sp.]
MSDQAGDSDLRRRAAWLLGLLVLVAVLVVALILTLTHTSGGGTPGGKGPLDSLLNSPPTSAAKTTPGHRTTPPSTPRARTSTSTSTSFSPVSCTKVCIVDGDPGNSVAAINSYRAQHGQKPVPGSVSKSAQTCALTNGGKCSGGWAESQVPRPTGAAALAKIIPLGKLLDPQLKSFEVGWAYDPNGHQYYFAIVKHS